MRLVALCSGGKDSSFALWLAMEGGHEIARIVAMVPRREDSWMFHTHNINLVDLFAECAGMPLTKAETSGVKELELEDLRRTLRGIGVDGVVSGAVASNYQKSRIERICKELGLASVTPLWGREPVELLREMIDSGFEVIITSVAAHGFDGSWLGRKIDKECIGDLIKLQKRFGVNICGEGGEYETLVLDAPFFDKRIEVLEARPVWRGDSGYLLIERAETKMK